MESWLEKVGAFLVSPIAGAILTIALREKTCLSEPADIDGITFGTADNCYYFYNPDIVIWVTCFGWAILGGLWFWFRVIRGRHPVEG